MRFSQRTQTRKSQVGCCAQGYARKAASSSCAFSVAASAALWNSVNASSSPVDQASLDPMRACMLVACLISNFRASISARQPTRSQRYSQWSRSNKHCAQSKVHSGSVCGHPFRCLVQEVLVRTWLATAQACAPQLATPRCASHQSHALDVTVQHSSVEQLRQNTAPYAGMGFSQVLRVAESVVQPGAASTILFRIGGGQP